MRDNISKSREKLVNHEIDGQDITSVRIILNNYWDKCIFYASVNEQTDAIKWLYQHGATIDSYDQLMIEYYKNMTPNQLRKRKRELR